MKNSAKLAVAFVLAMGLVSSTAMAASDAYTAGNALVGGLIQAGAGNNGTAGDAGWLEGHVEWVSGGGPLLYTEFDGATQRHAPSDVGEDRLAGIITAAGEPSPAGVSRADIIRIASAIIASNGATLNNPAGPNLGQTTFYDRGIPMTLESFIWACNIDAFKALANLVNILSKEQGFDLVKFMIEKGYDTDPKGARNYAMNLALDTVANQKLVAKMAIEKITVKDFAEKIAAQIPADADFKATIPAEGIKIAKSLAEIYKGMTIEDKPSVPTFDSKDQCCKDKDIPK